jgi:hypothetical protein
VKLYPVPAAGNSSPGVEFDLENYKSIKYIFPVIKPGNFVSRMYFEVLDEGLLVYDIAGITAPSFAQDMVDVPSAIRKRLNVIDGWILDGLGVKNG